MRVRNWVFTLNNPTGQIQWQQHERVTYASWQKESGENGVPHYQGYLELSAPSSLEQMKEILQKAHWEPRQGSQQQAITYCTKSETRIDGPWEYGTPKCQGTRNDLKEIKDKIANGATERKILEEHYNSWVRYNKAFKEHIRIVQPKRNWKTEVYVAIGEPGTGKSHWANEQGTETYFKQRSNWWDGYEGQDTVVIDDFYAWLPFDLLLRLCDKWPLLVETKGGQVNFTAKRIIFTSNTEPSEWYTNIKNFSAFERRVEHWMRFIKIGDWIETTTHEEFKNTKKIKP